MKVRLPCILPVLDVVEFKAQLAQETGLATPPLTMQAKDVRGLAACDRTPEFITQVRPFEPIAQRGFIVVQQQEAPLRLAFEWTTTRARERGKNDDAHGPARREP